MALLVVACVLSMASGTYGEENGGHSAFYGTFTADRLELSYSIAVNVGSHINGIGVNSAFYYADEVRLGDLQLGLVEAGATLSFRHYESYLGIPGRSEAGGGGVTVTYGLGAPNRFPSSPFFHAGLGTVNFSYRYNQYLSTDGTSQTTGRFGWEWAGPQDKIKLQIENDFYTPPFRDEFRTAAGELEYLHAFPKTIGGIAAGYMLWTGTTSGLKPVGGSNSLDLSGAYGGRYSHGIAYASLIWGIARVSVGFDSELIRDALQNTVHRMAGYYTLPKLLRKDKWYFQLSLFSFDSLYQ